MIHAQSDSVRFVFLSSVYRGFLFCVVTDAVARTLLSNPNAVLQTWVFLKWFALGSSLVLIMRYKGNLKVYLSFCRGYQKKIPNFFLYIARQPRSAVKQQITWCESGQFHICRMIPWLQVWLGSQVNWSMALGPNNVWSNISRGYSIQQ